MIVLTVTRSFKRENKQQIFFYNFVYKLLLFDYLVLDQNAFIQDKNKYDLIKMI